MTLSAGFPAVMVLRAQDCAAGFQLTCTTGNTLSINGLAPGTYYLFIDGVAATDQGPFSFQITLN
ncbi:MAG: hypothetical protein FJ098_17395 [Deltaproteobacteria bacterium]|nr:hypothetical protein [Deltaproteobacteria bacterium]